MTKSAARMELEPGTTVSLFADCLRLQYVQNSGAFLSMGDSLPAPVRTLLFTCGGIVMVAGAMLWAALGRGMSTLRTIGAALICGGGAGNLIDRLTQSGYVTDFLNIGVGPLRTGVFNLADFVLCVGVAIIAVSRADDGRTAAAE